MRQEGSLVRWECCVCVCGMKCHTSRALPRHGGREGENGGSSDDCY